MDDGDVGRVLVMSDEPARGDELAAALRSDRLAVLAVGDVPTACERLRSDVFDVVVADVRAPDFGALAVLRSALQARHPVRAVFVFLDPAATSKATESAIREAAFACLQRTAGADGVRRHVRAALDAQRAHAEMYEAAGGIRAAAGGSSWNGGRG